MVPLPPRGEDEVRHQGGREVLGGAPSGSTTQTEPARPDVDQRGVSGGMGLPTDEAQTAETPPRIPGDVVQRFRAQAAAQRQESQRRGGEARGESRGHPSPMDSSIPAMPEQMDMDHEDAAADEQGDQVMGFIGSLQPSIDDEISNIMLQQLGCSGRSYKREKRRGMQKIVSEIYSPPRITAEINRSKSRHLVPGLALDLTVNDPDDGTPWDFNLEVKREKARRLLRQQRPYLLIGSPMCRAFSTWQALNESKSSNAAAIRVARRQALVHLDFAVSLYTDQVQGGRYFLHEHPRGASSWKVPSMEELRKIPGVELTTGDQCQYGAEASSGPQRGSPVMKPTGFLSNAPCLLQELERRCSGRGGDCSRPKGGRHVLCSGKVARDAAIHPGELCRAVLRGTSRQLRADRLLKE